MRSFTSFRGYRGVALFLLSYSLILVKYKLIHSFDKHFRSSSFEEERLLEECQINCHPADVIPNALQTFALHDA